LTDSERNPEHAPQHAIAHVSGVSQLTANTTFFAAFANASVSDSYRSILVIERVVLHKMLAVTAQQ